MPKLTLTSDKLDKLEKPCLGRTKVYYWDLKQPGLCLIANEKGKAFYFIKSFRAVNHRIFLGPHPGLKLADARSACVEIMATLARGDKPKQIMISTTFADVFKEYAATVGKRQKSWSNTASYYRLHVEPYWAKKNVMDIERIEVQRWLNLVGEKSGEATANRAFIVFQSCLNWANRKGIVELKSNPTTGIDKFEMQSRERFLQPGEELDRFMTALDSASVDLRDFILMCLYTGARKSNVLSMRWEHIELDRQAWRIPGDSKIKCVSAKNGETQIVNLSELAIEILTRRVKNGSPWVFPSDSAAGHMTSPGPGFLRLMRKHGIHDFRIHDLRRTFGSYLAINGVSMPIIGGAMGHRDPRSTAIYARLTQKPVKAAVDGLSQVFKREAK